MLPLKALKPFSEGKVLLPESNFSFLVTYYWISWLLLCSCQSFLCRPIDVGPLWCLDRGLTRIFHVTGPGNSVLWKRELHEIGPLGPLSRSHPLNPTVVVLRTALEADDHTIVVTFSSVMEVTTACVEIY